ncbi:hypothetical protein ACHWQZ_G002533 [Mnemiopsis leidyi]
MAKVRAPMDFGVENMDCPVHSNIDLRASNNETVRANSLILSYNSPVFHEIFFKKLQTSVDVTAFTKNSVYQFAQCLYSGKVNLSRQSFRELIELADKFVVEWLLEQCDLFYMKLSRSIKFGCKNQIELETVRFLFDEAIYAPRRSRQKYTVSVKEKISTMGKFAKQEFIHRYATNYMYLSVDQLSALLELARGHDGILLKIVQENLAKQKYYFDEKSFHILNGIDFEGCLQSKVERSAFNQLFANTFVVKTQQELDNLEKILNLGTNAVEKVVAQTPSLLSDVVSIKDNSSIHIPNLKTVLKLKTVANAFRTDTVQGTGCPVPQRSLICDFNIVDELHDPASIPNLFSSLDQLQLKTLTYKDMKHRSLLFDRGVRFSVEDILAVSSSSKIFRNLYMVMELIIMHGMIIKPESDTTKSYLESIVKRLVEIKNNRGWGRVDSLFFGHRYLNMSFLEEENVKKNPEVALRILLSHCQELVSVRDSSAIVCQRGKIQSHASLRYSVLPDTIRMGEFLSTAQGTKRIYKFYWRHPDTTDCLNPKQCGFIINVTAMTENSSEAFNIGLCTDVNDYPGDIHFHPEIISAQKMHFVLRRDYNVKSSKRPSEMVYISWDGKPVYHSNHVHWGGQSIPPNGYIALVVFYDVSDVDLDALKKSDINLSRALRLEDLKTKSSF